MDPLNNTFSTALHNTNTIAINAEKWNRRTKETDGSEYIVILSAAHDDLHLRNYGTDIDESKFGREFSAIIHETGMLANVFDKELLEERLAVFIGLLKVDGTDYGDLSNQGFRRVLAYHTAIKVLDSRGLHTLEELAEQLLSDPDNGITSFDKVAKRMDLGFTFEEIWEDFQAENEP